MNNYQTDIESQLNSLLIGASQYDETLIKLNNNFKGFILYYLEKPFSEESATRFSRLNQNDGQLTEKLNTLLINSFLFTTRHPRHVERRQRISLLNSITKDIMKQFDIYNRYKRAIQLMLDFKFLTHGLKKHKGILAMAIKKFSKLKDSIEKIDKKIERLSDRKEFIAKNIDSKESKNVKLVNFSKLDTQSSHEKSTLLELFQKLTQMIYLIQRVSMRIDKVCEKVESLYRSSPPSVRESSAHYNQSIVSLLVYIKKNNVVRSDINHLIEHFTTLISHTPIHQRISSRHNTNLNFLKSTTKQFEFFTYNYFNQPFDERLLAAISNLMSTCYERIFELKNITGPAINKNDDHERVINNYLKQSETTLKMLKAQCSKVNKPAHRLKYLRRNLHN